MKIKVTLYEDAKWTSMRFICWCNNFPDLKLTGAEILSKTANTKEYATHRLKEAINNKTDTHLYIGPDNIYTIKVYKPE